MRVGASSASANAPRPEPKMMPPFGAARGAVARTAEMHASRGLAMSRVTLEPLNVGGHLPSQEFGVQSRRPYRRHRNERKGAGNAGFAVDGRRLREGGRQEG